MGVAMIDHSILWFLTGMAGMFALIALQMPIGVAMAVVGFVGTSLMLGTGPAVSILSIEPVTVLSNADLATIPLFLMMGSFASSAGITSDLYNVAARFVGHWRGGLAASTVCGSAGFGAISGSSVATTAAMAKIALPEMERRGYGQSLSAGSIAAGGSLAILIPPSIIMVIYAVLTEQFVIDLFFAGIIPGLISAGLYMVTIGIYGAIYPKAAPRGEQAPWGQRLASIFQAWRAFLIFLIVTIGIYAGIVTVLEAAAVGVMATFVLWLFSKGASVPALLTILRDSAAVTGMIYLMVIGAGILSYFVTLTDAPNVIVGAIIDAQLSPMMAVMLILLVYLFLGAVFDAVAAMVLTMPFVFPLILNLGFDPIWWGIVNVMIIEIAAITPPIGLNVFVMHASAPHLGLPVIFRGILPFLAADAVRLCLLLAFPAIATFLPNLLS
jgi:tripartite ATP-independent transporter DctM subunit